jgi:hypothetical protein
MNDVICPASSCRNEASSGWGRQKDQELAGLLAVAAHRRCGQSPLLGQPGTKLRQQILDRFGIDRAVRRGNLADLAQEPQNRADLADANASHDSSCQLAGRE